MSSAVKMYRMQPIVQHDFPVQLPNCMYKMKNLHVSRTCLEHPRTTEPQDSATTKRILDISNQNNQNPTEMAELQARQEQILQQLAQLKKQMDSIKANLNITSSSTPLPVSRKMKCTAPPKHVPDIVINASPTHPPYSLQIIQKLLSDELHLSVKTYQHSTISKLAEPARILAEKLESFTPSSNSARKVNVKLIWKDVGPYTELIMGYTPILGEINLLRFLARHSTLQLNYELLPNPDRIDSLLDTVHLLLLGKTKTARSGLLKTLHQSLNKGQWLDGRANISIADLAAYSVIKQVAARNEINVGVGKWMEHCEAIC